MNNIDLQTIKNSYGKLLYTYVTHEKDSDILEFWIKVIKGLNIFLVTITTSSILGTLITDQKIYAIISGIFSALALAFTIFQLSFNPQKNSERHKMTARELWPLRERYVNFITDIKAERLSELEIIKKRDDLLVETAKVYKGSPATSNRAYRIAQKALKFEEAQSFGSGEVDKFLPEDLKDN